MRRQVRKHWTTGVATAVLARPPPDSVRHRPRPHRGDDGQRSAGHLQRALSATIFGTDGNDIITGTDDSDVIATGDGNDTVFGLGRQDTACLGLGDDRFVGGTGSDVFVAESVPDGRDVFEGDGSDTISYAARTAAVKVSLDAVANDGQAGEGDNVGRDAVIVDGGSGPDVLTASFASLHGGPGDDRLTTGTNLFGEAGNDVLTHTGRLRAEMEGGDGGDRLVDNGTGGAGHARRPRQRRADRRRGRARRVHDRRPRQRHHDRRTRPRLHQRRRRQRPAHRRARQRHRHRRGRR